MPWSSLAAVREGGCCEKIEIRHVGALELDWQITMNLWRTSILVGPTIPYHCWWKQSCPVPYRLYRVFQRFYFLASGAGFVPSTVTTFCQEVGSHLLPKSKSNDTTCLEPESPAGKGEALVWWPPLLPIPKIPLDNGPLDHRRIGPWPIRIKK